MIVGDNFLAAILILAIQMAVLWLVINTAVSSAISSAARPAFRGAIEATADGLVLALDNTGQAPACGVVVAWTPAGLAPPIGGTPLLAQGATLRRSIPAGSLGGAPDTAATEALASLRVTFGRDAFGPPRAAVLVPVLLPPGMSAPGA